MKKKAIILIITLAAISLTGIVLTQLYWVKKTFELKEEQFDNSVRIAVKGVLNQIKDRNNDTVFIEHLKQLKCCKLKLDVTDFIEFGMMDSLIQVELGGVLILSEYYCALYSRNNKRFAGEDYEKYEEKLRNSEFQFSVTSIYKPGNYYLAIYFPHKKYQVWQQMEIWLGISILIVVALIISILFVLFTIYRQKKLSELKNDFINNLTHEFKTPIATSSLAAEMLLRPEIKDEPSKIKKYVNVILFENYRLQSQVEQMLQIAAIEIGTIRYHSLKVDVHQLIRNVLETYELRITENKIQVDVKMEAKKHFIIGDREHLQNLISNLVDNAMKYSPMDPIISIDTWNAMNGIMVRIKDNGVGIRKEHQKDIFKNLYRVQSGNIHETRGFGLGLYYVKTIVDWHKGRISVNSQPGEGASFSVFLPFKSK